jgi:hypothetical protein
MSTQTDDRADRLFGILLGALSGAIAASVVIAAAAFLF